jgi:PTS system nitrogen regulatory IIA component
MEIGELLARDAVAVRASAASKRQALAVAADVAARKLKLPADQILEALLEREAESSTGVGQGVAVPHARLDGVTGMTGVFVRLETPVPFDAVDDRPVDLMFALFAPKADSITHLRALARVSRTLRQGELREQLRQARTPDAVYALLVREAATHAA